MDYKLVTIDKLNKFKEMLTQKELPVFTLNKETATLTITLPPSQQEPNQQGD